MRLFRFWHIWINPLLMILVFLQILENKKILRYKWRLSSYCNGCDGLCLIQSLCIVKLDGEAIVSCFRRVIRVFVESDLKMMYIYDCQHLKTTRRVKEKLIYICRFINFPYNELLLPVIKITNQMIFNSYSCNE